MWTPSNAVKAFVFIPSKAGKEQQRKDNSRNNRNFHRLYIGMLFDQKNEVV